MTNDAWLPAGETPSKPGWYWYWIEGQKYPWISRLSKAPPSATLSRYRWSRQPVRAPKPPTEENDDH